MLPTELENVLLLHPYVHMPMNATPTSRRHFSVIGFFKLTRLPNLLIIAFTQYFAAIFLIPYQESWTEKLFDLQLFLLVSSTLMIAAAGYIINDYYDIKIDYVNKPQRVVVGKLIKRRVVLVSHVVLNAVGIGIGFYLNYYVGAINFIAGFLLWIYSNRLKRMPFVGNLVIALLTGLAILVLAIYYRESVNLLLNYAVFAFSINLIREVIKDMEDLRGDLRFGSKTLPIVWVLRKTKYFLYGMIALFVTILFYLSVQLQNPILNYFFMILIIPIIYFIYLLYRADSQRRFHQLSTYCKLLMLTGICSMAFF